MNLEECLKSRAMAIGTIQIWNGRRYKKTSKGWIPLEIEKRKLRKFYKEMRNKYGGSWIGEGELKAKMNSVKALIRENKAEIQRADGHFKVRFLKSKNEIYI